MTTDKYGNIRKSTKLTPEQWAVIDSLAQATNSLNPVAPKGTVAHSWRTMLKRLADGELVISEVS